MDNLSRGLTTVEVAGVDRVVDDAVLVDLVVADHHLDLEELVLAHGGGELVRRGVLAGVSSSRLVSRAATAKWKASRTLTFLYWAGPFHL